MDDKTKKTISVFHHSHFRQSWIFLPIGYYYNRYIQEAKEGDIILFSDGVKMEIEYINIVNINNSLTDFLCKKTYGVGLSIIKKRWNTNVVFEGHSPQVLDRERCLIIFLKKE